MGTVRARRDDITLIGSTCKSYLTVSVNSDEKYPLAVERATASDTSRCPPLQTTQSCSGSDAPT